MMSFALNNNEYFNCVLCVVLGLSHLKLPNTGNGISQKEKLRKMSLKHSCMLL